MATKKRRTYCKCGFITRLLNGAVNMASYKDFYQTPLMSAKNLPKAGITGTVETINPEQQKGKDGQGGTKLVIEINGGDVRIALNKTNAVIMAKAYGEDFQQWVGKKIKITTHKTSYMGAATDGLLIVPISKK
jgi:hypothetical protein